MQLQKKYSNLSVRTQMLALSAVFSIINIIALVYGDLDHIRLARTVSTIAVFVFFLVQVRYHNKWMYLIYLLFLCSSFGFYLYDTIYGPYIFLVCTSLAYIILSAKVLKKIKWKLINVYEYIAFFIIYLFNIGFHIYNVNHFDNPISSIVLYSLILFVGFIGITACLIAGFSNATRETISSAYYTYAIFAFVFADFAAMVSYYLEIAPTVFYFVERANYLFGLYILTRYSFINNKSPKSITVVAKEPFQDSATL